jgi:hypothetical protein
VDVKPVELVHAYAVPTPPPVKFKVVPEQMGELLLAVAVGKALTITATDAVLVQPATFVTVIV